MDEILFSLLNAPPLNIPGIDKKQLNAIKLNVSADSFQVYGASSTRVLKLTMFVVLCQFYFYWKMWLELLLDLVGETFKNIYAEG